MPLPHTRQATLAEAVDRLTAAGVDSPRRTAEWLLQDVLNISRAAFYANPTVLLSEQETEAFDAFIERRVEGEPLQYVLGHTDFFGLRLAVTPDVLIPRPETEEVAEAALRCIKPYEAPWILDVGTGSGALALALKDRRGDAEVFACDVSQGALEVAAGNAEQLGLEISFVEADLLDPAFADRIEPSFHLVVSNPPYVPDGERSMLQREVRDHEPDVALFVPDDDPLLFYRALAALAPVLLLPDGWLVVEVHADWGQQVRELLADSGFEPTLHTDLSARPRIVTAQWRALPS